MGMRSGCWGFRVFGKACLGGELSPEEGGSRRQGNPDDNFAPGIR